MDRVHRSPRVISLRSPWADWSLTLNEHLRAQQRYQREVAKGKVPDPSIKMVYHWSEGAESTQLTSSDAATPLIASETTASGGSSNPNSLPSTTTNIRANPTMSRNLGKPVSDEQKAILQDKVIAAIELVTRKIGEMASLETELCVVELAQNKHLVAWKKLFTRSNKALDDQNLHEHFVAEMCASMRVLLADKERDGTPDVVIHLESFRLEREVARLLRLKKRFNVLKKKHDKANDLVYAADVERKGLQGRFEVYHTEWTGIVKHMFAVREAFYAAGGSVDAVYDMELMRLVNEYGAHLRKDAESRKKGKE